VDDLAAVERGEESYDQLRETQGRLDIGAADLKSLPQEVTLHVFQDQHLGLFGAHQCDGLQYAWDRESMGKLELPSQTRASQLRSLGRTDGLDEYGKPIDLPPAPVDDVKLVFEDRILDEVSGYQQHRFTRQAAKAFRFV